jgi:hypothetical protein
MLCTALMRKALKDAISCKINNKLETPPMCGVFLCQALATIRDGCCNFSQISYILSVKNDEIGVLMINSVDYHLIKC